MNLQGIEFNEEAWRHSRLADKLPLEATPVPFVASAEADITFMGNQIKIAHLPAGIVEARGSASLDMYADDSMANLAQQADAKLTLEVHATPARPLKIAIVRTSQSDGYTSAFLSLRVKSGVSCSVLETCDGGMSGLTVSTQLFQIEPNATLEHALILRDGAEALNVTTLEYELERDATLRQTVLSMGARIARVQLGVKLKGENAHAHLASLNALSGKNHTDLCSQIQHEAPRSYSTQIAKNFLADESRGVFTGRIVITQDSQQVEAQQMNRNLLLSKKALALGQPQLEIYADDVKCAHGSSTGMVEEEATFYLKSRGIRPLRVQELLAHAFVQEVFNNGHDPQLTQALETAFRGRA